jgi:beta-N-acetylhexosaminidase
MNAKIPFYNNLVTFIADSKQNSMDQLRTLILLLLLTNGCRGFSQEPAFLNYISDSWVKATFEKMTLREKIGQLLMVEVYPDKDSLYKREFEDLLRTYKPGGILIMKGTPVITADWINDFQQISGIPLLTALDGESGPGFRMDSVINFPNAQTLGAVQNEPLIRKMGQSIGKQLKSMGIVMNFAPVADINIDPENPVISLRSYGDERENVARKALALAMGMQDAGIAAVAKHFPGHGDTRSDSHRLLPLLTQSSARIDSVELFPFKELIESGIAGIMTGHLKIPAVDPSGRPASLSGNIIKGLLQGKVKFKGLVVTDAMNMSSIALPAGKAEVQALKAGNDLLVFIHKLPRVFPEIEKAVSSGILTVKEIDEKCLKILAMKRWLGLHEYQPSILPELAWKLNMPGDLLLQRELTEGSLTVLKNSGLIPFQRLDTLHIATVAVGEDTIVPFQQMADRYMVVDHYFLPKEASPEEVSELLVKLKSYNLVIAGILNIGNYPRKNYHTTEGQTEAIRQLVNQNRTAVLFFGNAYALRFFPEIEKSQTLVMAYQADPVAQEAATELLFGAEGANGKLSVTADSLFTTGTGIEIQPVKRLKYTLPEEAGISSFFLKHKIDSLALQGLDAGAYPGCQVLIARKGKVIFHSCYGYLSFDKKEHVTRDHLYDFASVTKVSGPLPVILKLTGEGRFDLSKKMSDYLPLFRNSNKENILVRDVLAHQAQLPAVIPFWNSRLARDRKLREKVFSDHPLSSGSVRISSHLWMEPQYVDTMYQEINRIPLLKNKKYLYTCMGFTLWPLVIQNITGQPYETWLKNNIYKPLGAGTLTYNPYKYFPVSRMVPTEVDDYFRKEELRGFVHDEGAAMLGGISGNAGLFGTANDLAKLWQMYLQKGYYGGVRFYPEETAIEFNRVQFPENGNRRALGFDKPLLDNKTQPAKDAYPCKDASPDSFGHSGYTGTFVWADPGQELLFIFLSNRVNPTRNNEKLYTLGTRGVMLQSIYDAIKKGFN